MHWLSKDPLKRVNCTAAVTTTGTRWVNCYVSRVKTRAITVPENFKSNQKRILPDAGIGDLTTCHVGCLHIIRER